MVDVFDIQYKSHFFMAALSAVPSYRIFEERTSTRPEVNNDVGGALLMVYEHNTLESEEHIFQRVLWERKGRRYGTP